MLAQLTHSITGLAGGWASDLVASGVFGLCWLVLWVRWTTQVTRGVGAFAVAANSGGDAILEAFMAPVAGCRSFDTTNLSFTAALRVAEPLAAVALSCCRLGPCFSNSDLDVGRALDGEYFHCVFRVLQFDQDERHWTALFAEALPVYGCDLEACGEATL